VKSERQDSDDCVDCYDRKGIVKSERQDIDYDRKGIVKTERLDIDVKGIVTLAELLPDLVKAREASGGEVVRVDVEIEFEALAELLRTVLNIYRDVVECEDMGEVQAVISSKIVNHQKEVTNFLDNVGEQVKKQSPQDEGRNSPTDFPNRSGRRQPGKRTSQSTSTKKRASRKSNKFQESADQEATSPAPKVVRRPGLRSATDESSIPKTTESTTPNPSVQKTRQRSTTSEKPLLQWTATPTTSMGSERSDSPASSASSRTTSRRRRQR